MPLVTDAEGSPARHESPRNNPPATPDQNVTPQPRPATRSNRRSASHSPDRGVRWAAGLAAVYQLPTPESAPATGSIPTLDWRLPSQCVVRTTLFVVALAAEKAPLLLVPPDLYHVIGRSHAVALTRAAAVARRRPCSCCPGCPARCRPFHAMRSSLENVPSAGDALSGVDRVAPLPLRQAAACAAFSASHLAASGWSCLSLALFAGTLTFPLAAFALARDP